MDELGSKRLERAEQRLPSEDEILQMFELHREARFRVEPEERLLTIARLRIRAAAARFGRSVETKYIQETRMMFGIMPLTEDELSEGGEVLARRMDDVLRSTKPPKPK